MEKQKAFGQLSRQEQLDLFSAWLDGKVIEYYNINNEEWEPIIGCKPLWLDNTVYRVAITKPSIDWKQVSLPFRWLAKDADGVAYLFTGKPFLENYLYYGEWCVSNGAQYSLALSHVSYNPGTCDWKDSLVERPTGV